MNERGFTLCDYTLEASRDKMRGMHRRRLEQGALAGLAFSLVLVTAADGRA